MTRQSTFQPDGRNVGIYRVPSAGTPKALMVSGG